MHDDTHLTVALPDEPATLGAGAALAECLEPGTTVWLEGELGAGKTTLVRGLLRARGEQGTVKSPTYALVELYPLGGLNFCHFDFYRFQTPDEFLDAGLDDHFGGDDICLVEWPEKARPHLPPPDLRLSLHHDGNGRQLEARAESARGTQCLKHLAAACSASPRPR